MEEITGEYQIRNSPPQGRNETDFVKVPRTPVKGEDKCYHCNKEKCICTCSRCGKVGKQEEYDYMREFEGKLWHQGCVMKMCSFCRKDECTCKCVTCGKIANNVRLSEGKIYCFTCLRCSICKVGDVKTNSFGWKHLLRENFICGNCV
jgi:hypothetical protein